MSKVKNFGCAHRGVVRAQSSTLILGGLFKRLNDARLHFKTTIKEKATEYCPLLASYDCADKIVGGILVTEPN